MNDIGKLGPHILSKRTLDGVFHYRKEVLNNIESIRAVAYEYGARFRQELRDDPQQTIMNARSYSNAISILGSRGSGKTSVIMTLRHMLTHENPNKDFNIMMPFLAPQDFTEDEPLLGWVVSHLLRLGEKTISDITTNNFECSMRGSQKGKLGYMTEERFAESIQSCIDEVLNGFSLRSQNALGHRSIQLPERDQAYYYVESIKQDTKLQASLLKLIGEIIEYKATKNHSMKNGTIAKGGSGGEEEKQEPLIIFTIDDLDLTPSRCTEVVELILRYLQHPNVVVLCGWNHELFQNHLTMDLLKAQGVLNPNTVNQSFDFNDVFMMRYRKQTTAMVSARRLALDSLKKAFPPAQRYEIRSLTNSERANFTYGEEAEEAPDGENMPTLFDMIQDAIKSCVHSLYSKSSTLRNQKAKNNAVSFLKNDKNENLEVYTRIFDNKARGLINVHKAFAVLKAAQEEVDAEETDEWDITDQIRNLFDTILFSNTRFAPYRRGIRDLVQIHRVFVAREPGETTKDGKRRLEYFCNFEAIESIFAQYSADGVIASKTYDRPFEAEHFMEQEYDYFPSVMIDVFLLLNFMENFFHAITQTKSSTHGGREFSRLLNKVNKPINFEAQPIGPLNQAIELTGIRELKFFPDTEDIALNVTILNAYENEGFEDNRYQFTGFRTLEHIFELANNLLTGEKGKLDEKKVESLVRSDVNWLAAIMTLFRDLFPTSDNVRRYGAYVSLLNSLNGDREEAQKKINTMDWGQSNPLNNRTPVTELLTDEDLDTIVLCLRLLDKSRNIIDQWERKRSETSKKGHSQNDTSAILRSRAILNCLNDLPDAPAAAALRSDYMKERYSPLLDFKASDYDSFESETDVQSMGILIRAALNRANKDTSILLYALKDQLLAHIQKGYHNTLRSSEKQPDYQLRYLLQVGLVLSKYVERWELLPGTWDRSEENACMRLKDIFQENALTLPYEAVTDIRELGRKLAHTGRDRYSNSVGALRQWVSAHDYYFDSDELMQIREALRILADAPKKIRRAITVDDVVYNVMMRIEELVALECGKISEDIFNKSSKTASLNDEKAAARQAIWPVHMRYDQSMNQLNKALRSLIPQTILSKSSLFDASYSEIQLFYNAIRSSDR